MVVAGVTVRLVPVTVPMPEMERVAAFATLQFSVRLCPMAILGDDGVKLVMTTGGGALTPMEVVAVTLCPTALVTVRV